MGRKERLSRRDMIKKSAAAGAGLSLTKLASANEPSAESKALGHNQNPKTKNASVIGMKFSPMNVVRIGVIGVGARGSSMLREFLAVDNVQITALCYIVKEKTTRLHREREDHERRSHC